ncbi:unnamed protein product [Amoebophrya sp. A25]|nr:unnamed protein product [Amoebophrya sp. A25]|eukprot:GSA25T00002907001.1
MHMQSSASLLASSRITITSIYNPFRPQTPITAMPPPPRTLITASPQQPANGQHQHAGVEGGDEDASSSSSSSIISSTSSDATRSSFGAPLAPTNARTLATEAAAASARTLLTEAAAASARNQQIHRAARIPIPQHQQVTRNTLRRTSTSTKTSNETPPPLPTDRDPFDTLIARYDEQRGLWCFLAGPQSWNGGSDVVPDIWMRQGWRSDGLRDNPLGQADNYIPARIHNDDNKASLFVHWLVSGKIEFEEKMSTVGLLANASGSETKNGNGDGRGGSTTTTTGGGREEIIGDDPPGLMQEHQEVEDEVHDQDGFRVRLLDELVQDHDHVDPTEDFENAYGEWVSWPAGTNTTRDQDYGRVQSLSWPTALFQSTSKNVHDNALVPQESDSFETFFARFLGHYANSRGQHCRQ